MSDVLVNPVALVIPGSLVEQGRAIANRLQLVFPATKFQFRVLPPKINAKKWLTFVQGNQPFLGLGWNGFMPNKSDNRSLVGHSSWTLLCAVKGASMTDMARYYGDAQGIGALTVAGVAAAVLHGAHLATGAAQVTAVSNVAADDWTDDCVVVGVNFNIPATLHLNEAITRPDGLGLLAEIATTWNVPDAAGGTDIYTSDWENPNV